jgi:uncharacterized Zn finger protein (UPF0148 family)
MPLVIYPHGGKAMFDDVIRKLKHLERGVQVPIQLPLDDDGYLDRRCSHLECESDFKVLFDDWRDIVRDEEVFCPLCCHTADSGEWNTESQQEHIQQAAKRYMQKQLGEAFRSSARRFNQSQPRGGFISMSMSYRPGPLPILLPISASETMRQQSACEKCQCRYSSIGAAFFCPACGHNSASSTFDGAVATVSKTLEALEVIQQALIHAVGMDTAEDSIRQICENGLVKLVSAFQRFAEARFDVIPNRANFTPRRNLFQNLSESNDLWQLSIGSSYKDMLSAAEHADLERYFQKRHLLAHREGLVDQPYIDKSGDNSYAVGQRLIIRSDSVRRLADLVAKLANELRRRT